MAADITTQNDRYPWLGWATTGLLTLAAVLIFGLVNAALHPPLPSGPQTERCLDCCIGTNGTVPLATAQPAAQNRDTAAAARPTASAAAKPMQTLQSIQAVPGPIARSLPSAAPPAASHAPAVRPKSTSDASVSASPPIPAKPDAAKRAAYVKAVADVRRAMARRDLASSKRQLKLAAANVQSDAEAAEAERLETLQDHLEQFWTAIRRAVAAMQPVDEIALSESVRVAVIESSRTELVVQMHGRRQRYRIEALPMELVSAIAKDAFKPTPGTKLFLGSVLAMDAHGDRAAARKLWNDAIKGGESDGKLLLPELDVPIPKTP